MKAKIKECDMIVDVEHQNLGEKGSDISFWCESLDKSFSRYELDFDYNKSKATTEPSETQMRYEIAKDCVSATLSRTHIVGGEIKDVVGYSIRVADELINQLKQHSDEQD